ncbi:MAG: methyltransferase [Massilibacteroides sp.]|nr:methyltransferase [Massilibacteroides sp.]
MANPFFQFKQFCVYHDKCAMKVGTDGVLLGAWADVSNSRSIADIGTGSGLIALMLAQRSEAKIDSIDIEYSSYIQAKENINNSIFNRQINVHHTSLEKYIQTTNRQYDLIVSNPPYFHNSLHSPFPKRTIARHDDKLTLADLLSDSLKILAPKGRIAIILPYDQEQELTGQAKLHQIHIKRKTGIRPKPESEYKRLLVELTREKVECQTEELTIEKAHHEYTKEYISLTKDFYLKM